MIVELEGFELQAAIAAAAAESGRPVLNAGRGQPNWLATDPRDAAFVLGRFAVAEAAAASDHPEWGMTPAVPGIAARLAAFASSDDSAGAAFLRRAVEYGVATFGFDPDAWVHELVRAVLGDGYPSPNRMLSHVERVMERYLTEVTGAEAAPPGTYQVFGTEGGAAAMAYVFRSLQENGVLNAGDKVAIATPVFTPYLQIPVLEDFGLDVVEVRADHNRPSRFGEGVLDQLLDPAIKVFFLVNPGNPDTRAVRRERLRELRDLVTERRPDLVIVTDTVYATFVDGFRGVLADLPHNVICVHSFSRNFGATGSRLGFLAVHRDNVLDRILAAHDDERRRRLTQRYSSLTSDASSLPFMARLVADSREVALHNITGLATPDQLQMALFALAYLMPSGRTYVDSTRAALAARDSALRAPLRIASPGGQDSRYYALLDLLQVTGRSAAPPVPRGSSGTPRPRPSPSGWPASTGSSCCPASSTAVTRGTCVSRSRRSPRSSSRAWDRPWRPCWSSWQARRRDAADRRAQPRERARCAAMCSSNSSRHDSLTGMPLRFASSVLSSTGKPNVS